MIVFLNFAPIDFMGGAEKWMMDMSTRVNKKEETILIDVSPHLANIYGKLVLKRDFKSHLEKNKQVNNKEHVKRITLTFFHFLPFTKQWFATRKIFNEARLVYIKFELWEVMINLYFGGWSNTKKTIAGLHSPFTYKEPINFFDRLHNTFYQSTICKFYLSRTKRIHVLNFRDENLFKTVFKLHNVIKVANSVPMATTKNDKTDNERLQIIFAGVLSLRKGIDTLINVMKQSPDNFDFHVIGGGPMEKNLLNLNNKKNFHFHGYVSYKKLNDLYSLSDVVLFPSRSESFGLVLAEGIAFGSQIIIPKHISLGLPSYIEHDVLSRNPEEYINILKKIWNNKKNNKINKVKIQEFAINNFSPNIIYPKFFQDILELPLT